MTRTFNAISPSGSFPVSGSSLILPFPDYSRPVGGGWDVAVSLRSTTGSGRADIIVAQAGRQLKVITVDTTTAFSTYNVFVSDEALGGVSPGLCNISDVVVIIRGAVVGCCEGVTLPDTLTYSMSSTCGDVSDVPVSLARTAEFFWEGTWSDPTGPWAFRLHCAPQNDGTFVWIMDIAGNGCGNIGEHVTLLECDPLMINVPGITCYYCINSYCPGNQTFSGVITA